MKLKYIRDYKSIGLDIKSCLESLNFPDFSIITGTNGSGKTHLLEAIVNKHITISIKDIENYGPITYFNYQNFFLDGVSNIKIKRTQPIRLNGGQNEFIFIANQLSPQNSSGK